MILKNIACKLLKEPFSTDMDPCIPRTGIQPVIKILLSHVLTEYFLCFMDIIMQNSLISLKTQLRQGFYKREDDYHQGLPELKHFPGLLFFLYHVYHTVPCRQRCNIISQRSAACQVCSDCCTQINEETRKESPVCIFADKTKRFHIEPWHVTNPVTRFK